jgi:phospholipid-translocating ATPase
LDKDIIREMWVKGDLKDQLDLSHRKNRRDKDFSDSSLEAAPMFANVRAESLSEIHHNYEPAMADSPPYVASSTGPTTYLDTPPMNDIIELPPREPGVQYAPPTTKPSNLNLSPTAAPTPSPQPSYYSATDIPIPSPLPSPKYQLPSGEYTSTPPSRKPSIATSRATSIRGPVRSPTTTSPPSHSSPADDSLSIPPTQMYAKRASAGYPEKYEMQTYDERVYGPEYV